MDSGQWSVAGDKCDGGGTRFGGGRCGGVCPPAQGRPLAADRQEQQGIEARNTCVQFVRGRELTVAESLRLSFESVGVRRETAIE